MMSSNFIFGNRFTLSSNNAMSLAICDICQVELKKVPEIWGQLLCLPPLASTQRFLLRASEIVTDTCKRCTNISMMLTLW